MTLPHTFRQKRNGVKQILQPHLRATVRVSAITFELLEIKSSLLGGALTYYAHTRQGAVAEYILRNHVNVRSLPILYVKISCRVCHSNGNEANCTSSALLGFHKASNARCQSSSPPSPHAGLNMRVEATSGIYCILNIQSRQV